MPGWCSVMTYDLRSGNVSLRTRSSPRVGDCSPPNTPGALPSPAAGVCPAAVSMIMSRPTSAVLREVAEETSQQIVLGELIKVQTSHWVGRSPYGTIEDFHAVRLIYRATCPHPTDPVVLDQGGTTESAQWVPLDSWRSVSWTKNWQLLLSELLKDSSAT